LEHRDAHPIGYGCSQFCDRYGRWARTLKSSMRWGHLAGEKLFVDFAGQKPALRRGWLPMSGPARRPSDYAVIEA
jgi:hypothetical protein